MALNIRAPLFAGCVLGMTGMTLTGLAKVQETTCLQVCLTGQEDCNTDLVKVNLANRGGPMVVVSQAFLANNEKHSSLHTVIKPRSKLHSWTAPIAELGRSRDINVAEMWVKSRSRRKSSYKSSDDNLRSLLKKSKVQLYVEYKYCYVPWFGFVFNDDACLDLE
jgi:hypothetical protein